jgi:aromatic ring-opening dioxygenase LigB subunit
VALLVMGDGSARRSEHSPVHLHPRAEIFDSTVAAALDLADATTLAALDPELALELQAAGRAPWQVLAGATASADLTGNLLYHAAPYGVGYFVASWTL